MILSCFDGEFTFRVFYFGLFTACDMQDFTLSFNVNLQVVYTIDVLTLEIILLSYLAHLGHMRTTTT